MKNQFLGLFLLSLFPASLFAQTVEQDTSVRQGKLKNGLTYYIRHNNKEAGLADFYIAQRVGSIWKSPTREDWLTFWNTWLLTDHKIFKVLRNHRASYTGVKPMV